MADETPTPPANEPTSAPRDENYLSGEEKRARLKEEYKKELLARKNIQAQIESSKRMSTIQNAMDKILNMNDDTEDWISKLNQTAAMAEAKLEMALGLDTPTASTTPTVTPQTPTPTEPVAEKKESTPENKPVEKTLGDQQTHSAGTTSTPNATLPIAENENPAQARKSLLDDEK